MSSPLQRLRRLMGFKSILVSLLLVIAPFYIFPSSSNLLLLSGAVCPSFNVSAPEHRDVIRNVSLAAKVDDAFGGVVIAELWQLHPAQACCVRDSRVVIALGEWKEYIKVWWRPKETRGVLWFDQGVKVGRKEGLPEIRVSGNTSKFKYTNRQGQRLALRISRVVLETLRLGMKDVQWFVMGDDDTVFIIENLMRILSKYDYRQFYYVRSSSESHVQNIFFSYNMAYGGGGFVISYPLALELAKMQDKCIQRYPGMYGSNDRMQACMPSLVCRSLANLDFTRDLLGILAAHPVTPLVSLHHVDVMEPIFLQMTRVKSIHHLFESIRYHSASIMQQSICYDQKRRWTVSVSWGYVVQILRGVISPREMEMPMRTFLNWYRRADYTGYAFNTRPALKHPCQKPLVFYMKTTNSDRVKRQTVGLHIRPPYCRWKMASPELISSIVVIKQPDVFRWQKSPRRDCCRILPRGKSSAMHVWVGQCRSGEISGIS